MRKFNSLLLILGIVLSASAQDATGRETAAGINWSSYDTAQKADNNNRKFFIYFYTDQCGYCRLLESKTFKDETIIDYINSNYMPVRVNAGKDIKVASRFGIQGVPDLRFLSPEGQGIARWPGYIESSKLLFLLQYIATDSYKSMNFSDFVSKQALN